MRNAEVFDLRRFVPRPGFKPVSDESESSVLSTQSLFAALDDAVRSHRIVTLAGPPGSGKKTALDEWARNGVKAVKPHQIIFVSMSPSPDKPLPPICIALSRIWDELEQIARPSYIHRPRADGRSIKMYNARALED